jgi:hypothetical protein
MLTNSEAFWLQFTTVVGTITAPIIAVLITIWYQKRQSKTDAKVRLFMDLVSFRNHYPVPWQFSVALNRIDVVYHKEESICRLYHEYYDIASRDLSENEVLLLNEKKIALITAMARHLGYNQIDQIYLQRYYQAKGVYDDYLDDVQLKTTAYQYFLSGKEMNSRVIARMDEEGVENSAQNIGK